MARNLLKNPCAEEQLEFWEEVESGGDGWSVEDAPGDCGADFPTDDAKKYFASSFEWCSKSQTIDLLSEGYSGEDLDNNQPNITVGDWYGGRTDAGSIYELHVQLLSEDRAVITEYKSDMISIEPTNNDWKQITHTFSGYGPGVRFVRFKHGGQDSVFWKGYFGARMTNSSVTVEA
ncbi:F-box only protein 2 [Hyperolius riggenbachi]|uniref:F-box only protein 2 n=1 Tax=Hyperolius riggenbachi TaxID=752182 RepID=UPI0035A2DCB1